MGELTISLVSRELSLRAAMAQAFDEAPSDWCVYLTDSPLPNADVVVVGEDIANRPAGALPFDPLCPTAVLTEIEKRRAPSARAVAVVGVWGGAGATTVALHLAQAVAPTHPTCYVEATDRYAARYRLGLEGAAMSWAECDGSEESLRRAALPVVGGLRVLLRPTDGENETVEMSPLVAVARRCFQRIVIDSSEAAAVGLASDVDVAVLVSHPTPPSIERCRDLVGRLSALRCVVITNRVGRGGETTRSELEAVLGGPISLELPCCPALRDAEDDRRLVASPLWRWSRSVARLARVLFS